MPVKPAFCRVETGAGDRAQCAPRSVDTAMTFDHTTALIPIDVQQGFDYAPWPQRNNPAMEANGQLLLAAWRARTATDPRAP
jgi:hypothetical protein